MSAFDWIPEKYISRRLFKKNSGGGRSSGKSSSFDKLKRYKTVFIDEPIESINRYIEVRPKDKHRNPYYKEKIRVSEFIPAPRIASVKKFPFREQDYTDEEKYLINDKHEDRSRKATYFIPEQIGEEVIAAQQSDGEEEQVYNDTEDDAEEISERNSGAYTPKFREEVVTVPEYFEEPIYERGDSRTERRYRKSKYIPKYRKEIVSGPKYRRRSPTYVEEIRYESDYDSPEEMITAPPRHSFARRTQIPLMRRPPPTLMRPPPQKVGKVVILPNEPNYQYYSQQRHLQTPTPCPCPCPLQNQFSQSLDSMSFMSYSRPHIQPNYHHFYQNQYQRPWFICRSLNDPNNAQLCPPKPYADPNASNYHNGYYNQFANQQGQYNNSRPNNYNYYNTYQNQNPYQQYQNTSNQNQYQQYQNQYQQNTYQNPYAQQNQGQYQNTYNPQYQYGSQYQYPNQNQATNPNSNQYTSQTSYQSPQNYNQFSAQGGAANKKGKGKEAENKKGNKNEKKERFFSRLSSILKKKN